MPKPEPTKTTHLSDLSPNPKNPRRISDERLAMLKKSLGEFGDLSGIIFNKRSGQLVGGHQRTKILPPDAKVVRVKTFEPATSVGTVAQGYVVVDGERYSYREVEWDATKEKAANIAANKHSGEWDIPQLAEWLVELDALHFDMDLLGFDEAEKANIIKNGIPTKEGLCDEDEVPEPPKEPKTKRGDIYQLGGHRLMCGDSTCIDDVERLMAGQKANLVFTDPPYGVNYDGGHAEAGKRREKLANDDSTQIYSDSVPMMFSFSESNAALYLWFAATKSLQVLQVLQVLQENDYLIRNWIIWNKNMAQFGAIGAQYKQKHEPCIYAHKKNQAPFWAGPNNEVSVWDENRASKNEFHPTQKPVELSKRAIQNSCPPNGIVLDLFGGSGATLVGAEATGRAARLMELDPRYVDVIVARWEKFTGRRAELVAPSP